MTRQIWLEGKQVTVHSLIEITEHLDISMYELLAIINDLEMVAILPDKDMVPGPQTLHLSPQDTDLIAWVVQDKEEDRVEPL